MKDDKLCISPDALIAMIVTEAQDRALAQMPGPEAPLGEDVYKRQQMPGVCGNAQPASEGHSHLRTHRRRHG